MDINNLKQFLGVYFARNQWAVVPKSWLAFRCGKLECHWPNLGNPKLLAQNLQVPDSSWGIWPIQRIAESSDLFERVEKKMTTSNVSSTDQSDTDNATSRITGRSKMHDVPCTAKERKKLIASHRAEDSDSSNDDSELDDINLTEQFSGEITQTTMIEKFEYKRLEATMKAQGVLIEKLLDQVRRLTELATDTNLRVKDLEKAAEVLPNPIPGPILDATLPPPSNSLESLNDALDTENIAKHLLLCEQETLRGTVRAVLKVLMTRDLALTFSLTGMTSKRLPGKVAFQKHKIFDVLLEAIRHGRHANSNRDDIKDAIKRALCGVIDWDGGRKKRLVQLDSGPLESPCRLTNLQPPSDGAICSIRKLNLEWHGVHTQNGAPSDTYIPNAMSFIEESLKV